MRDSCDWQLVVVILITLLCIGSVVNPVAIRELGPHPLSTSADEHLGEHES